MQDEEFALVFKTFGIIVQIIIDQNYNPQPFTIFGYSVAGIESEIKALVKKGLEFINCYFMEQDRYNICTTKSGTKIEGFNDPDNSFLSITQFAK